MHVNLIGNYQMRLRKGDQTYYVKIVEDKDIYLQEITMIAPCHSVNRKYALCQE